MSATPSVKYSKFMEFLVVNKKRIEYMTSDMRYSVQDGGNKSVTNMNFVTGVSATVAKSSTLVSGSKSSVRNWKACLACDIDGATNLAAVQHPMESCAVWNSLSIREKESRVKCRKHPFKTDHTT